MIGEVYITSSIALFIAVFGWSDKLFGFSRRIIDLEVDFCNKIQLKYYNYKKLMDLLNKKHNNQGEFTKKIVSLIRDSKIKEGSTQTFNALKENNRLIRKWKTENEDKKIYFVLLFFFLFIMGTLQLILPTEIKIMLLMQANLMVIIFIGYCIYRSLSGIETRFEDNLNKIYSHNRED